MKQSVVQLWADVRIAIENKVQNPQAFDRIFIGSLEIKASTPIHMRKSGKRSLIPREDQFNLGKPLSGILLTRREVQVLYLICRGYTNGEVADNMGLSPRTAEYYIKNMRNKVFARSKSHLIQLILETDFLQRVNQRVLQKGAKDVVAA